MVAAICLLAGLLGYFTFTILTAIDLKEARKLAGYSLALAH